MVTFSLVPPPTVAGGEISYKRGLLTSLKEPADVATWSHPHMETGRSCEWQSLQTGPDAPGCQEHHPAGFPQVPACLVS